jgi:hypothetical protein
MRHVLQVAVVAALTAFSGAAQAAEEHARMADCLLEAAKGIAPDHSLSAHDAAEAVAMKRCRRKVIAFTATLYPPAGGSLCCEEIEALGVEQAVDMAAGLVIGYRMGRYDRNW